MEQRELKLFALLHLCISLLQFSPIRVIFKKIICDIYYSNFAAFVTFLSHLNMFSMTFSVKNIIEYIARFARYVF